MDNQPAAPGGHPTDAPLSPSEELMVVGMINSSFQLATQQADSKVSMLLVVHPGVTAVLASQLDQVVGLLVEPRSLSLLAAPAVLAFTLAFLVSGYHLMQGLRPRLTPPAPTNRFAFPAIAAGTADTTGPAGAAALCAESWALARMLADIAMTKNRHVSKSLSWVSVMVTTALTLLALGVLAG
ncbi:MULTISPECIES: hypothetical protein [Micromonospora]|uniref:Pycsar effector protein domain-containing protein n=1 Tax=Micromonospora rifamycinica TaxID=291594 RepID=A0A1C5JA21_9ACTN|nr:MULTISPECIES: hypothetical protein [Micromonospora]WFE63558.1 hypothetical protein O7625_09805 [Micromonospora sp. WMMD714]SCG67454.1 hypothetical protein GA0070623_3274 [Micromonospora rifamycinica]